MRSTFIQERPHEDKGAWGHLPTVIDGGYTVRASRGRSRAVDMVSHDLSLIVSVHCRRTFRFICQGGKTGIGSERVNSLHNMYHWVRFRYKRQYVGSFSGLSPIVN